VSVMLGHAAPVAAQVPICAPPSPSEPYYTACAPGGRIAAARMLFDLTVDHIFKPDSGQLLRRPVDVLRAIVSDETLEKNAGLRAYLDGLAPLTLTKIDTATGLAELTVADDARRFSGPLAVGETPVSLTIQLPPKISGGYWRTPGVLQMAFWEGQRAKVGLTMPDGRSIDAEIECLAVSTDGLRIVTAGATPDVIVRFEDCP